MRKINIKGISTAAVNEVKESLPTSVGFAAIGTISSTIIAAATRAANGPRELAVYAAKKMIKCTVTNMTIDAVAGALTELAKHPYVDDTIVDVEISQDDIIDDDDDIIID